MTSRLVVLVSGEGTNLQALIDACRDETYGAHVVAVGADRGAINGLAPSRTGSKRSPPSSSGWLITRPRGVGPGARPHLRRSYQPDLIILAGFMKLVGPSFLDCFGGRCLNTHPALLPSFPGTHGVRDTLAHGVKVTGCTVFIVDDGVDAGPIVAQASVQVADDDDEQGAARADQGSRAGAARRHGGQDGPRRLGPSVAGR